MSADPRRVKDLFVAALDLPDRPARAALLDRECAGDLDLRHRVDVLLAAHERPEAALDRPLAAEPATAAYRPRAEAVGAVVAGKYKLLEPIGEGGMGEVWVADQLEPIRRRVALKVIKAGMDSRSVLARFEAERQALALMDHPNIARVLDAGATADGRPFFAMELVKGTPITEFCDARKLSPRERLELFVPVCQAIQHAHQKGIIHRDIKPSNVLVALHDEHPVPKVIDFGVAKAVGQQLTDKTLYTGFGALVGTPAYMAPEQATFNQLDVDTRADVYALGVLLYELLAGSPPFEPERLKQAALDEVLRLVREEDPPRPSARLSTSQARATIAAVRQSDPDKLARLVKGELDWIVMKALEKDRARRYETANGLAADVERYLAGEAVQAVPPSAGYRLRKFVRRNGAAAGAAGAVAAALVLGAAAATWQAVRATRAEAAALAERDQKEQARQAEAGQRQEAEAQRDRAAKAEAEAKEQAAVARAVNDFLQKDLLAQANPELEPDRDLRLRTLLDRAARQIDGKFPRQPLVEAAIRQTVAETYAALGLFAAAQPHLERALDLRRRHLGEGDRATLWSMNELAFVLREQDRGAEAEALYRKTLELRRRALGDDDPDTAITTSQLSFLLESHGRLAEAEPLLRETVAGRRRALGDEHPITLGSMTRLTALLQAQGKLTVAEAEASWRKLLEARRRIEGNDHPNTIGTITSLIWALWAQGKVDEAERLCREGLATARRVLGDEHRRTVHLAIARGEMLRARGDLAAAEPLLLAGLEDSRRFVGEETWQATNAMTHLAALYRDQGKFDRAEALAARAVELRRRVLGEDQLSTLWQVHTLATVYEAQGKHAQAEPLFAKVLEVHRRVGGSPPPGTGSPPAALGANLLRQGKFARAEPLLRECLNTPDERRPAAWQRFHTQCLLGRALAGQGKYADAEPLLLAGYEGLKAHAPAMPVPDRNRTRTEALDGLVRLYEGWGKPAEAARWRAELARDAPPVETAPPPRELN